MSDQAPAEAPRLSRLPADHLTTTQRGLMVAVLAAFFGIAFGGPALTRLDHRRRIMQTRIARQTRDVRSRAHQAGRRAKRKLRRLGGGPIWR